MSRKHSNGKQDFYEVLGVAKNASKDEISKAYKKLALQHHPDRNKGNKDAEEKFKTISEAYSVLSDDKKRQQYDMMGQAGPGFGDGGFGGFGGGGFGGFQGADFMDIFSSFMGGGAGFGGGQQQQSVRGADIQEMVRLTLEEAFSGVTKVISMTRYGKCGDCSGQGSAKGSPSQTCPLCKGKGYQIRGGGFLQIQAVCSGCNGSGQIIKDPCKSCSGTGRTRKTDSIKVVIPAGIDHGEELRLSGEGHAGERGAKSGDLYVQVLLEKHSIFKRDGLDLHCELPIQLEVAMLGKSVKVPTIEHEELEVDVPRGTQPGKILRAKGRGMKRSGRRGDLYLHVQVEIPTLADKEISSWKKFFEVNLSPSHYPKQTTFFEKLKGFFKK